MKDDTITNVIYSLITSVTNYCSGIYLTNFVEKRHTIYLSNKNETETENKNKNKDKTKLEDPIVPTCYSRFAFITATCIGRLAYNCFTYGEYIQGIIASGLYTTTLLHWNYPRRSGIILDLDKLLVRYGFLFSIYSAYKYQRRSIYYTGSLVNIMGFMINEHLNSKSINDPKYLKTASSDEKHRTYLRACIVHMLFLHIGQSELGIWTMKNGRFPLLKNE